VATVGRHARLPWVCSVSFVNYRCQGGYVFIGVSWLVSLFVSKSTQKLVKRYSQNSVEGWHIGKEESIRFLWWSGTRYVGL